MKLKALIITFIALAGLTVTAVNAFHISGTWYYQNIAVSTKAYPYAVHSQADLWVKTTQPVADYVAGYRWLANEFGTPNTFIQVGTKALYDDASPDFFAYTEDIWYTHTCLSGSTSAWNGKGCYINVGALGVLSDQWCRMEIGGGDSWVPANTVRVGVTCNSVFYPLMDVAVNSNLRGPGWVVNEAAADYQGGTHPTFTQWKQSVYATPAIGSMFIYTTFFKPELNYGSYLTIGPFFDNSWIREYGGHDDWEPVDCAWGTGAPGLQGTLYDTGSDATAGATGGACYDFGYLIY